MSVSWLEGWPIQLADLGEAVTFVVNDSGEVSRMKWHGNYSEKVR